MALGREHRALVQSCRGLADELDNMSSFDADVWREYRLALKALGEAVEVGGDSDTLAEFFSLRGSVRDAEESGA